ncbi:peptidoglycan DD-metalloendopeptidase family protein [Bacillus sp. SB49]|uniref:peptidoglycan DD-metalloendopeptidase family protein n=1 Tax=Bacillus sp. SB49 TaxID=1071080 RepID=UPI000410B7A8|nr:peptidoglycan DD-metalloendopeptidase family protein [Bacillus sp. SB49]QHT48545.1 peptidoglycan DD-metalloendopeptidase family protein [Bacillus sp. SB49]
MWKKVAVTAVAVTSLSVGTVYAERSLDTVYHVYVDDKPVGTVTDKSKVESYLDQKLEEADVPEEWDTKLDKDVSYKAERVFSADPEEKQVLDALDEEVRVTVNTVQVNIDGRPVAHVPDEAEADQVVEKYKEEYVQPEVLQQLEEGEPADPKPGETKVMDVSLGEKVSYDEQAVPVRFVDTVDEAVDRIKEGDTFDSDLTKEEWTTAYPDVDTLLTDNPAPSLDVIVRKMRVKEEEVDYPVEVKRSDDLYKGEKEVKQEGQPGEKEIHTKFVFTNGEKQEEEVVKEETTKEPVKKVIIEGTKAVPSRGDGTFIWPAVGGVITSKQGERWGRYHKGIDIAGVKDKTIKAADNGKVVEAGFKKSFGNKVVIDHGNGYETIYAHLESIDVKRGDVVKQGGKIGKMGTTGHSTGVHLHFEIHKDGALKNPLDYVSK